MPRLIYAGFPPTAIFHGFKDTTIPIDSSLRLVQQLRDVNVPVESGFEGVPHAFDSNAEFAVAAAQMADLFLIGMSNPRPSAVPGRGGERGWRLLEPSNPRRSSIAQPTMKHTKRQRLSRRQFFDWPPAQRL
jgi:acetyl esterase/lipase